MRYKLLNFSIIVASMTLVSANLFAQKTAKYNDADDAFKKATEFFEKQKYGLAGYEYESYVASTSDNLMCSDAVYYSALCAIELFNKDAEYKTSSFINEFPESARLNYSYFHMGRYQYREKKYRNALDWFEKFDPYDLTEEEKAEYYFKTGYSYFVTKEMDKAEKAFYEIKDLDNKYHIPATYFFSHIAYTKKNFETALAGFEKLSTDESFGPIVPYYITQIYFLQEKYEKVISYSPGLLDSATTRRIPEIARIIGESYYRTNNFKDAIPYLEIYKEKSNNFTRSDIYELGFAYYKTNDRAKAIAELEKLASQKDSISQNSLYLLAECYLAEGQKNMARIVLGNAAKLDLDPFIKEDAMYNYAKLTYELSYSPFNEAISTFNDFIKMFPNSTRLDEVYTSLGKVYMNTKNYKEAIEVLENVQNVTNETEEAYQRVTFFRGLELFNNLKFDKAIISFDKSLNNSKYNQVFKAQSIFWKGECYYRMGRYDDAISQYSKFILSSGAFGSKEFNLAYYGLGYSYFKKADYKQALSWFRKYVDNMPGVKSQMTADAYCRIGDCDFVTREYDFAVENYSKAISIHKAAVDYAMFQKGFCLGILKQNNEKIIVLNELLGDYPSSPYVDDALFELGKSYSAIEEKGMAIATFQKLIDEYPASDFVRKSYIQMGMEYYNSDENENALAMFKKVIENYGNTTEAKDAYTGLKNVYLDMNDVNTYYAYLKERGNQNDFRITEQDSLMYNTAEKVYMSGDYAKSKGLFDDYMAKFNENGIFSANVFFYSAECYVKDNKLDEAAGLYKKVLGRKKGVFTEPSLVKVAKYEYDKENYQQALDYYIHLEGIAEYKNNIIFARVGKMRGYFKLNDYDNAKKAAVQLLTTDKISDEYKREAHYIVGKCEYALGNLESALEEFSMVAKNCKSAEEAEAKYLICEIYFKQNQFESSEKEVFDFVKKNTPQQKWLGKAFLLLSDVYIMKPDFFQARATLQSVIDNYMPKDDGIVDDAKAKLDQINILEEQEKLKKQQEQNPVQEVLEINMNETKTN